MLFKQVAEYDSRGGIRRREQQHGQDHTTPKPRPERDVEKPRQGACGKQPERLYKLRHAALCSVIVILNIVVKLRKIAKTEIQIPQRDQQENGQKRQKGILPFVIYLYKMQPSQADSSVRT